MPTREPFTFDDLATLAEESLDGIEYEDLKKVLEILVPGIKIVENPKDEDEFFVSYPE